MGYRKERIIADSAEPKSIDELKDLGIYRISAAKKRKRLYIKWHSIYTKFWNNSASKLCELHDGDN